METWDCVDVGEDDPSVQVRNFDDIIQKKLDQYIPQKQLKFVSKISLL